VIALFKLKKALPLITAIAVSLAVWTLFPMGMVIAYKEKHDLLTIIIGTLLCLVFGGSTTWDSIRAYQKWKKKEW